MPNESMAPPQPTLDFEGRTVAVREGDTVASALFRAGVRVFSRSFKYRRPRGLYCLTGDCPNCLVNVDGEPSVRACVTAAVGGQRVRRETGWPSADRDLLRIFDRIHPLLPVGFYYKTLVRPRWLWPTVEPLIRRIAGRGTIDPQVAPRNREARNHHPDVAVIGGGISGLAAALAAAERGDTVMLCDEGRLGDKIAPGPVRDRLEHLGTRVRESAAITLLENAAAIGIYEGPLVVVNGPDLLHLIHPKRIVVATGAVEEHGVFPGNDLPGVWLGRGAARLAGVHGVLPGRRIVLVGGTAEADQHAQTLRQAGAAVEQVDGRIVSASGRRGVERAVVESPHGRRTHACDALVLSLGHVPRDSLARMADGFAVTLAGDAAAPGLSPGEAEAAGSAAGRGEAMQERQPSPPDTGSAGVVCICEDVAVGDLERAWQEGFRSTEILKRYTTATMGPCQGVLCHRHLRAFVAARPGATGPADGPTTARPPARPISLEEAAAGVRDDIHQQTALHDTHLREGAVMELAGNWWRPRHYGEMLDEYWAVRRAVSIMDVGTLGKFLVSGPDATEFLDRLYPCRIRDLEPGRLRYALLLGEHGYLVDDGTVCRVDDRRWYLTFTSAGASTAEATLRAWLDEWRLEVHIADLTAAWGAINVAGPKARELLARLSTDSLDNASFPYLAQRSLTVAEVSCRALRLGFVGELSYELHHPASSSTTLWKALLEAGRDLGVRPHGLDALRLLRLEKGHILVGQDTDFDATPAKLNIPWAARLDKPTFVGKQSLERANSQPPIRTLVAVVFERGAPREGAPLRVGQTAVGYLSSSGWSPALERGVALGWVTASNGEFPREVEADGYHGSVVDHAFYDSEGIRVRA
jgi:sarcosine oxidase subunit alpha